MYDGDITGAVIHNSQMLCTNVFNNQVESKIEESKILVRILKFSYIYAL